VVALENLKIDLVHTTKPLKRYCMLGNSFEYAPDGFKDYIPLFMAF
jgi:hypothetical protein